MYYLYILKSIKYKKSYVGISDNVNRRLKEHNAGKMFFTKRYKPWEIIYTENFSTLVDAQKREKYMKSGTGRRFMKKLFNN